MKKVKKQGVYTSQLVSVCCSAPIRTQTGLSDFVADRHPTVSTCWYVCTKCNLPCDAETVKGEYQPLSSGTPVVYPSQGGSGILLVDNLKESKLFVNQPIAPLHVTPPWSVTITKVREGFLVEELEELTGEGETQYQRIQNIFESPEHDPDDLDSFQRLIWFLIDHFDVCGGIGRKMDINIYDPNKKTKKREG